MRQIFILIWIITAGAMSAFSQDSDKSSNLEGFTALRSFGDSIQYTLENTPAIDTAVARNFLTTWNQLNSQQKMMVREQVMQLAYKKHTVKTRVLDYYGALVAAATGNKTQLDAYLDVSRQVVEYEDRPRVAVFFEKSYLFFKSKVAHIDNFFQLHIGAKQYRFDYITEGTPSLGIGEGDGENIPENENLDNESILSDGGQQDQEFTDEKSDEFIENEVEQQLDIPIWMRQTTLPVLKGPVIRFDKINFLFSTRYDSVTINNTKGTLSLTDNIFVGEGGTVDWSSAGLSKDSVHFEFQEYYFNTSSPAIKKANGRLTYVGKVDGGVEGVFEFRSTPHNTFEEAKYPKFTSFNNDIEMLGLAQYNLKYIGGFALDGKDMHSRSINNGLANLKIMDEQGNNRLSALARSFEFNDSTVLAKQARVTISQGEDSIYQSSVHLWYHIGRRQLILRKEKSADSFYSMPYFNIGLGADKTAWNMASDSLFLSADGARGQAPMVLESINFYNPEDFRILSGYGFHFHPVVLVANYSIRKKTRLFYVSDMAVDTGQQPRDIDMAMTFLAKKGLLDYDASSGLVQVKDKLIHIFNARKGKIDYDNLKMHSVIDGPANAILSLQEGKMDIRGIDRFKLSDSLNVFIEPDSSIISLLKNRSIKFDGRITAGNLEINGKGFEFNYESFSVGVKQIDSIRFYVQETNEQGQTVRRRINNTVEGVDSTATTGANKKAGTLYINKPNNKSGRIKMPSYPRLDAEMGGVIYFDKKDVLNGAYDRSVFYILPPFELDSLNEAKSSATRFDGKFISGGIFPPFEQQLYTRYDKSSSLGFTHTIPNKGYQLFGDEGKAEGIIDLSNDGIRLKGKINYLTATLRSPDFVCYPDSIVGEGYLGKLETKKINGISYPGLSLPKFKLKWQPKRDYFALFNIGTPFSLYNATATLDGKVVLSRKGLFGSGKLSTREFEAQSAEFTFREENFEARQADFQLNTKGNPDKKALSGKDIRLRFSLKNNYADISPEVVGTASLEFPYAQFKTSIPEARWYLDSNKVVMKKRPEMSLKDSYFYTTRKDLDSLNFMAERAEYDMQTQILKVKDIPFIIVADAKITPENSEITIFENAKIGTLQNASVTLDTLNEYHHLVNASIDIISRKRFNGRATYRYINTQSDTFDIKMTDFQLKPIDAKKEKLDVGQGKKSLAIEETVASGVIAKEDNFILAPRIFYKGNITMYATRPALQLDGSIKLDLKKIKGYDTWVRYRQSGNEEELFLDFDKSVTEGGKQIGAGLHFDDNSNLYITFVSSKKNLNDKDFFLPSGSLFYNKKNQKFSIEDRLRASGEKLTGKAFNYDEEKQEVYFAGPVNFFDNDKPDKTFNVLAHALGSGNLDSNEIEMNALLMIDMNVSSQAFSLMATDLRTAAEQENLEEGLGDQTELLYKIANIVGERTVENFEKKSANTYTSLTSMRQLLKPLVFSDVHLKRSKEYNAFYSTGTLGLSNVLSQDINGALEGFMEIKEGEDGTPIFHLFFRAASYSWYYFGLEGNRLLIYSANDDFNSVIAKKTTLGKSKIGKIAFALGSEEETLAFIDRFRREYYGIEKPFELRQQAAPSIDKEESDDGF